MIIRPILFILFLLTKSVYASTDNIANSVFDGMVKSTPPMGKSTRNGAVIGFGSASMRVQDSQFFSLYNLQLPSMRYGCSGIDLNLGAFSMANWDSIVQQLRSIASGTLTYAFGTAVDAMCNSCWSHMQSWQNRINKHSEILKGGCEAIATEYLDAQGDDLQKALWGANENEKVLSANKDGEFSDVAEAKKSQDTKSLKESCGSECNYNVLYSAFTNSDYKSFLTTFKDGSSLNGIRLIEYLMSVTGTYFVDNSNYDSNSDFDAKITYEKPLLDIKSLLEGGTVHTSIEETKIYRCANHNNLSPSDAGFKCLIINDEEQSNFVGLYQHIFNILNLIYSKFRLPSKVELTPTERLFLERSGGQNFYAALASSSTGEDYLVKISKYQALMVTTKVFDFFERVLNELANGPNKKGIPKGSMEVLKSTLQMNKEILKAEQQRVNSDMAQVLQFMELMTMDKKD